MRKNTDLTKIIKKSHENKWVALSPDRSKVVDYSENLVTLREKVGNREVTYMKVLSSNVIHAF